MAVRPTICTRTSTGAQVYATVGDCNYVIVRVSALPSPADADYDHLYLDADDVLWQLNYEGTALIKVNEVIYTLVSSDGSIIVQNTADGWDISYDAYSHLADIINAGDNISLDWDDDRKRLTISADPGTDTVTTIEAGQYISVTQPTSNHYVISANRIDASGNGVSVTFSDVQDAYQVFLNFTSANNTIIRSYDGQGNWNLDVNDALYYDKNEINTIISEFSNGLHWLPYVDDFDELATTYPDPELGDTVWVQNENTAYHWDGENWESIFQVILTLVDEDTPGLMSSEMLAQLNKATQDISTQGGQIASIQNDISVIQGDIQALYNLINSGTSINQLTTSTPDFLNITRTGNSVNIDFKDESVDQYCAAYNTSASSYWFKIAEWDMNPALYNILSATFLLTLTPLGVSSASRYITTLSVRQSSDLSVPEYSFKATALDGGTYELSTNLKLIIGPFKDPGINTFGLWCKLDSQYLSLRADLLANPSSLNGRNIPTSELILYVTEVGATNEPAGDYNMFPTVNDQIINGIRNIASSDSSIVVNRTGNTVNLQAPTIDTSAFITPPNVTSSDGSVTITRGANSVNLQVPAVASSKYPNGLYVTETGWMPSDTTLSPGESCNITFSVAAFRSFAGPSAPASGVLSYSSGSSGSYQLMLSAQVGTTICYRYDIAVQGGSISYNRVSSKPDSIYLNQSTGILAKLRDEMPLDGETKGLYVSSTFANAISGLPNDRDYVGTITSIPSPYSWVLTLEYAGVSSSLLLGTTYRVQILSSGAYTVVAKNYLSVNTGGTGTVS